MPMTPAALRNSCEASCPVDPRLEAAGQQEGVQWRVSISRMGFRSIWRLSTSTRSTRQRHTFGQAQSSERQWLRDVGHVQRLRLYVEHPAPRRAPAVCGLNVPRRIGENDHAGRGFLSRYWPASRSAILRASCSLSPVAHTRGMPSGSTAEQSHKAGSRTTRARTSFIRGSLSLMAPSTVLGLSYSHKFGGRCQVDHVVVFVSHCISPPWVLRGHRFPAPGLTEKSCVASRIRAPTISTVVTEPERTGRAQQTRPPA